MTAMSEVESGLHVAEPDRCASPERRLRLCDPTARRRLRRLTRARSARHDQDRPERDADPAHDEADRRDRTLQLCRVEPVLLIGGANAVRTPFVQITFALHRRQTKTATDAEAHGADAVRDVGRYPARRLGSQTGVETRAVAHLPAG